MNIFHIYVDEAEAGSCGCPKTAKCQKSCTDRNYQGGRCMGFLGFSCACLKGRDWINMSNQC